MNCESWRYLGAIEDLYLMRKEDVISLFIDDVHFAKGQFSFGFLLLIACVFCSSLCK